MNTLSSLLNWIGVTIGANPSTLTTTSKTFVGSINEVAADVAKLKNVATFATPVSATAVALTGTNQAIEIGLASGKSTSVADYTESGDGGVKITTSGKYLVSASWSFNSLGTGGNTLTSVLSLKRSGVTSQLDAFGCTHTGAYYVSASPPIIYELTANDVLYVAARNNTGNVGNLYWGILTIQRVE